MYELLTKTYDAMYYSAIMKRKAHISQRKIKLEQHLMNSRKQAQPPTKGRGISHWVVYFLP